MKRFDILAQYHSLDLVNDPSDKSYYNVEFEISGKHIIIGGVKGYKDIQDTRGTVYFQEENPYLFDTLEHKIMKWLGYE